VIQPAPPAESDPAESGRRWSLLSPHGFVVFALTLQPDATLRDLSRQIGLTERTLHGIIKELAAADMVRVRREGRRNIYRVNDDAYLPHPMFSHIQLGTFLDALRNAS
jgi:DNA-binding transcriptional ArsR family regulator